MKFFTTMMMASLLILSLTSTSQAGVIIGGTRVIYAGDKKEASLSVSNPDGLAYLIQSWIEPSSAGESRAPFIITPPLYRLDRNQQNVMRIVLAGNISQDKESMFWLNIKSIPSVTPRDNTLQVAVKTRIKLIYRPVTLNKTNSEEQADKLKWQRTGDRIQVTNPTAYYMNFNEIRIGSVKVDDVTFVAPGSSRSYAVPAGGTTGQIQFRLINDYGGIGVAHNARL